MSHCGNGCCGGSCDHSHDHCDHDHCNHEHCESQPDATSGGRNIVLNIKNMDTNEACRGAERILRKFRAASFIKVRRGKVEFRLASGFDLNRIKSALKDGGFYIAG